MHDEFDYTPQIQMKGLSSLMDKYEIKKNKHEYEFQEICADLEKDFGRGVWALPHRAGFTEYKIKKAGEIARERGVLKLGYLIGIIKKLPY